MSRKVYTSEKVAASGPYSQAVDSGEFVYFSGQTAKNALIESEKDTSITSQTKQCFDNLFAVMKEANLTEKNILKVNAYITSMKYFDEMNAAYEKYFHAPYPARTCVAVLELPLGADVEIEIIAKK